MQRSRTSLAVVALAATTLVACGGDDAETDSATTTAPDGGVAPADTPTEPAEADPEPAEPDDSASGRAGLTHSTGSATVTIDSTTYRFGSSPGSISVCTNLHGSFQVSFPLIDDAGTGIDGNEITLELIEPGSRADTQAAIAASAEVVVPDGAFVAGDSSLAGITGVEPPPIDLVPGESSASGTITMIPLFGGGDPVQAEITVQCG